MKTVAFSKDRVDAGEIERHVANDRKEHMQRGYFAVVGVTVLGAIVGWLGGGGVFQVFEGAGFAFVASAITAAFINSDHNVYYRFGSSMNLDE